MSYVLAFVGFALLIILHEAGHFLAAKAVGMRVDRFSLFFGPMVVKHRRGETEYGVGVIPLGGYVKIAGMNPLEPMGDDEDQARAYYNQAIWKRVVVIAAGPAMNLLVAFVLAWVVYLGGAHTLTNSRGQALSNNTVAGIYAGSAADRVLHLGDRIVSVDGIGGSPAKIHDAVATHTCPGDAHRNGCVASTAAKVLIRRNGKLFTLLIRPRWSSVHHEMLLGIVFGERTAPNTALFSAGLSVSALWSVTKTTVSDIAQLFKPAARRQLHSIVGAYEYTQQEIATGLRDGAWVLALISLSLAIINLFPFLPLDGGHIFWALVEGVRGRKVSPLVIERASFVGLALIGLLLFIGLRNDISSLANGGLRLH
ncbi:MAG: M50 family metallopeptidase [Solirubrobacteraceae bacterium]